ncbi:hypothetical protein [Sphingomonas sp.]|uniref:hypothetical protein n=1 Tax=Sphingomonas sp. TaxID=28214 RepID=UPI002EDB658A
MNRADQHRSKWRRVALMLLACALLFKLPVGFMPESSARGVAFGWCNAVSAAAEAEGKALLEKALAERPQPKQKPIADEPCPFAAAAQPITSADQVAEIAIPSRHPLAPPPLPATLPGRGLAAPPPSATGPPLLS